MQGVKRLCWILIYILNKKLQKVFSAAGLYIFVDRFIIVKRIPFPTWLKDSYSYLLIRYGSKAQNGMKNITEKAPYFRRDNLNLKEGLSYCFS